MIVQKRKFHNSVVNHKVTKFYHFRLYIDTSLGKIKENLDIKDYGVTITKLNEINMNGWMNNYSVEIISDEPIRVETKMKMYEIVYEYIKSLESNIKKIKKNSYINRIIRTEKINRIND